MEVTKKIDGGLLVGILSDYTEVVGEKPTTDVSEKKTRRSRKVEEKKED